MIGKSPYMTLREVENYRFDGQSEAFEQGAKSPFVLLLGYRNRVEDHADGLEAFLPGLGGEAGIQRGPLFVLAIGRGREVFERGADDAGGKTALDLHLAALKELEEPLGTENNMVNITDAANHETGFAYDALGRVTQVTFPSTLSESYAYDAMNDLLSKTDRKGQTINYGYDALYRLTSKTYPDQTAVNYTYDPLSRLTQVTDPTGTYSFTYDNLGRLVSTGTQYSFLSSALNNSYSYDAASNRTSLTDAAGYTSSYSYDSLNRLTGLTNTNSGSFGFGYDALGRRTSLTRPNGVNTSYSYDTLSRLLGVLHNGGALPGSASYTYDAAGNRLTKTAVQEASPNPVSVLSQYSYDNIYELTQAVVNGSVARKLQLRRGGQSPDLRRTHFLQLQRLQRAHFHLCRYVRLRQQWQYHLENHHGGNDLIHLGLREPPRQRDPAGNRRDRQLHHTTPLEEGLRRLRQPVGPPFMPTMAAT